MGLRARRYGVASIFILLYVIIIGVSIAVYANMRPHWGLQLDPHGPVVCVGGQSCSAIWIVQSAAVDPVYFLGVRPGVRICGYDGHALTTTTTAAMLDGAHELLLLSSGGCTHVVTQDVAGPVTAMTAFGTAILCAMLAIALFLHGTRRRLITLTVAFLSCLLITMSLLPIIWMNAFFSTLSVIAATYGAIPLLALLLWQILLAPSHLRWIYKITLANCGVCSVLAGLLGLAVASHHDGLLATIISTNSVVNIVNLALIITIIAGGFRSRDAGHRTSVSLLSVAGIIAVLPLLLLTVIPLLIGQPPLLDGQFSGLTVGMLPLALTYLALRRELIVVDSLIRQTARLIIHYTAFLLFGYLDLLFGLALPVSPVLRMGAGVLLIAVLAPVIRHNLSRLTESLFFPEVGRYRAIAEILRAGTGTADIAEIAGELQSHIQQALPVSTLALFVEDQMSGLFVTCDECAWENADPVVLALRRQPQAVLQLHRPPFQMFVPMALDRQLIAFLALGEREDGFPYTRHECRWLLTLGGYRTLAIDYARKLLQERLLREASEREKRKVDLLGAVAAACSSAPEADTVARKALTTMGDRLAIPFGCVAVPDAQRQGYARVLAQYLHNDYHFLATEAQLFLARLTATSVEPAADLELLRVLAGEVAADDPHPLIFAGTTLQGKCYPLRFNDDALGVLYVAGTAEVAPDHSLVETIARELVTALHRAHLYEDAQRLAMFDPLTGLANHRALQERLQRELAVHAGRSLPVSLLMLDIDHFRRFNELYGHDVGDHTLRTVARAVHSALRPEDTAARYGGEEFVVVLPNTDAAHAHAMAERVRHSLAARPIVIADATVAVTVSIGHATFPLHASAPPSLLKAADLALYNAKRSGRDRVCAYTPMLLEKNQERVAMPADLHEIGLPSGADLEAVQALIAAIDLYDGYTASHSESVSRYAVAIGTEMGLPAEEIEALRLGGLVHDVGKIGVSVQVLRKPGKLDAEEWTQMQAHTTMGEAILRPVEHLRHLLPLVRSHHERLDGTGYPDGLKGDEIPDLVRVMSVADVFDAFTAERPYHPGRSALEGVRLLQDEVRKGRMDIRMVSAMERLLLKQGRLDDEESAQLDAA